MHFKRAKKTWQITRGEQLVKENEALSCELSHPKKVQYLNSNQKITTAEKAQAIIESGPIFDFGILLDQTHMTENSYYYHYEKEID